MAAQSTPFDLSSAQQSKGSSLDTSPDSDYEYEYDDNETEEIYFTLDLTTHVPNAIQEKTYAKNGRLIRPDKSAVTNGDNPPTAPTEANGQDAAAEGDERANAPGEAGTLQVLDLHTEKPYVKFNNGFYSCHWFTDLGTQFWITDPGVVSDPKLSGHVLDVVGSSQTRLIARPANLKRKRNSQDQGSAEGETAVQPVEVEDNGLSDVSDAEGPNQVFEMYQDPNEPMVIPRQKIKDPHLAAQADFMERLSALKLRKGEKDAHKVPMRVPVYYRGAHNERALRAIHGTDYDDPEITSAPPEDGNGTPATPTAGDESQAQAGATEDQDPNAPITLPRYTRRTRGGARGGAPSNAARRSNLGLELMSETQAPPPKKRGRVSNAEKARRAAEAREFALDPELGGAGASTPQAGESASQDAEASTLLAGEKPRKRRRTKAQMEEARRLDQERRASEEASQAGGDAGETGAIGRRSLRRTSGRRDPLTGTEEAQAGREMRSSLDGASNAEAGNQEAHVEADTQDQDAPEPENDGVEEGSPQK